MIQMLLSYCNGTDTEVSKVMDKAIGKEHTDSLLYHAGHFFAKELNCHLETQQMHTFLVSIQSTTQSGKRATLGRKWQLYQLLLSQEIKVLRRENGHTKVSFT
jgi:hypothetical protein